MKIAEDSFFKECKKFEDLEKKLFQKIKNLRDSVKGDKVYDDNKIDKESFHLTIFLESDLIAYSRLYKSSKCEVSLQRFSVAQKYSCLLYTSPSPRDSRKSRMPSSA